jgi:uncharacterized protein
MIIPAIAPAAAHAPHTAGQVLSARSLSTPAIFSFFAVTFGWTWGLWAISSFIQSQAPALGKALFLAAGFGPSFAAIIVLLMFGGVLGLRDWLRRCLAWRFRPGWYAVAFFAAPVAMVVALGIHGALGGNLPAIQTGGPLGHVIATFGLVLIIGGPLGEEFGWRGYALPTLTARFGWRRSSLIVGALWGLWHVPLFYIPGTGQSQMPIALFLASSFALSIVFARLSINTAFSVVPALLLHWSINAWSLVIPMIPNGSSVRPYVLVMGILFVVAATAFLLPGPKKAPSC